MRIYRWMAALLAALFCVAAAGCGAEPSSPSRGSSTDTEAESALLPENEIAKETIGNPTDLLTTECLHGLQWGMTMAEVTTILGEPSSRTEPEYWAADGLEHMSWLYDGAELSFTDEILKSVTVWTPRQGETQAGVCIGSGADEIRKAYAGLIDEELSSADTLVIGSIYGGFLFTLRDGIVAEVLLGSAAE